MKLVDANLLVCAVTSDAPRHQAAKRWLESAHHAPSNKRGPSTLPPADPFDSSSRTGSRRYLQAENDIMSAALVTVDRTCSTRPPWKNSSSPARPRMPKPLPWPSKVRFL